MAASPGSFALYVRIAIPRSAFGRAMAGIVNNEWHKHAGELGQMERDNVRGRTPYRTGALRGSVDSIDYTSSSSKTLVRIGFDDEGQDIEWGRVYSYYQEGEPLGRETYTNPPREMLNRIGTDDAEDMGAWAEKLAQEALDAWTEEAQAEADAAAAAMGVEGFM